MPEQEKYTLSKDAKELKRLFTVLGQGVLQGFTKEYFLSLKFENQVYILDTLFEIFLKNDLLETGKLGLVNNYMTFIPDEDGEVYRVNPKLNIKSKEFIEDVIAKIAKYELERMRDQTATGLE